MESWKDVFQIDESASDEECLFVDIQGKGTVLITKNDDGFDIDAFPFHIVDEPIVSRHISNMELTKE